MKKILIILILLSSFAIQVFAGGSVCLEKELKPLLNQKPALREIIINTFDIAESGWAPSRIGSNVNKKYGGKRLGPYFFNAKPKGDKGEYIFVLIFHTERIFLDSEGKSTDITNAYTIKEKLTSIEIKIKEKTCFSGDGQINKATTTVNNLH